MRIVVACFLVTGCASAGQYEWRNNDPVRDNQVRLEADQAECRSMADYVVPIPDPRRPSIDKAACPEPVYGMSCHVAGAGQERNKSEVKAAERAHQRYYVTCLDGMGWRKQRGKGAR